MTRLEIHLEEEDKRRVAPRSGVEEGGSGWLSKNRADGGGLGQDGGGLGQDGGWTGTTDNPSLGYCRDFKDLIGKVPPQIFGKRSLALRRHHLAFRKINLVLQKG